MGGRYFEIQLINQMAGLWKQSQTLALAFSISLFSLAGLPPLGGFFAKLYALNAFLNEGYYWVAIIAVIFSALSIANYLSIIKVTHFDLPLNPQCIIVSPIISYIISIISTFLLFFILNPASLLNLLTHLLFITLN